MTVTKKRRKKTILCDSVEMDINVLSIQLYRRRTPQISAAEMKTEQAGIHSKHVQRVFVSFNKKVFLKIRKSQMKPLTVRVQSDGKILKISDPLLRVSYLSVFGDISKRRSSFTNQLANLYIYHHSRNEVESSYLETIHAHKLSIKETDCNNNACDQDEGEASETMSQQKKVKRRVSFNKESASTTDPVQSPLIHKELYRKGVIITSEKVHPAMSKRKEQKTLKLSSSNEDFQNDRKKKALTLEIIDKMCEDEVKPFKFDEDSTRPSYKMADKSHCAENQIFVKSKTGDDHRYFKGKLDETEYTTKVENFSSKLNSPNIQQGTSIENNCTVGNSNLNERPLPDGKESQSKDCGSKSSTSNETSSSGYINLEEIKNAAKTMVSNTTKKALDFIDGLDKTNIDGISRTKRSPREISKYHSNLSKITEEKEPTEKRKQILRKIYGELCTDYRSSEDSLQSRQSLSENEIDVGINTQRAETRGSFSDDESEKTSIQYKQVVQPQRANPTYSDPMYDTDTQEIRPVCEYETTDEELDCDEDEEALSRTVKRNTVVIPKPVFKTQVPDIVDSSRVSRIPLSKDLFLNEDEDSPREPEQPTKTQQNINPKELIKDIDACLTDVQPSLVNKSTIAPNPFPVDKNRLTRVQPPKSDKPNYKRKKMLHNPLLAGVEDDQTVQPLQASSKPLGKLKEVQNRKEPTPALYLNTGKCQQRKFDLHTDAVEQPIGRLQPQGKDSANVNVKFYTENNSEKLKQTARKSQGYDTKSFKVEKSEMSESQKIKYAKMKVTFRAREENLPTAKFWTDIARGCNPMQRSSPEPSDLSDDRLPASPITPIGFTKEDGYHVGISNSDADLNRFFFQAVASKPQFYKDQGQILSSFPLADIPPKQEQISTPEENLKFFRNVSMEPDFWEDPKEKDNKSLATKIKGISGKDNDNKQEGNSSLFKKVSKQPQEKAMYTSSLRSPFNEPPLGSTEHLGRNHPKGAENIQFFLNVSRNPTAFYHQPSGPFVQSNTSPVSPVPQGYKQQQGYIPDDPKNYVDLETADDNLKFFKVISKGPSPNIFLENTDQNEFNRKNWVHATGREPKTEVTEFLTNSGNEKKKKNKKKNVKELDGHTKNDSKISDEQAEENVRLYMI